ncbi:hypothetical protein ACKKBF_B19795 [Auxenochlorella protothecoides x Auxenochlorella symbiontica]
MSGEDWTSALAAGLQATHARLNSPATSWILWHGCIPCIILGSLWLLSALRRYQELRRHLRSGTPITADLPKTWPSVAIVTPIRGCREHSSLNLESILSQEYEGEYECFFVTDSEEDPAVPLLHSLIAAHKKATGRAARILFSGQAQKTSQKIHNLLAGIEAGMGTSDYTLCLDDDVQLPPRLLTWLVRDLASEPGAYMATGYPFDIPPAHPSLLSYAVLSYHLPLVIGFSLSRKTSFVWGGCMLFRSPALRSDSAGLLEAWRDGGYSDDLITASLCGERGLGIICPPYAVFPQRMPTRCGGAGAWWYYLRRQLVVLDTYASPANRHTNAALAAAHCYWSWALVAPAALLAARAACFGALGVQRLATGTPLPIAAPVLPTLAALALAVSWAYAGLGLGAMTAQTLSLCEALNPRLAPGGLFPVFSWGHVAAGVLLNNAAVPVCMALTFCTSHVTWAGIRYRRKGGRVVAVEHPAPAPAGGPTRRGGGHGCRPTGRGGREGKRREARGAAQQDDCDAR